MFKYKFLGALPTHNSEYPFRINEVLHYINSWLKDIDAVKKQGKTGPYSPQLFEAGIESLRIAANSYLFASSCGTALAIITNHSYHPNPYRLCDETILKVY
jgi:hypothetical protein